MFVWKDLIKNGSLPPQASRDDLLLQVNDWLQGGEDRDQWSLVWRRLLDEPNLPTTINRDVLLRRGYAWLEGREDCDQWCYVWQRLLAEPDLPATIQREDLFRRGYAWLDGREGRDQWAFVLQCLLEWNDKLPASLSPAALLACGAAWLAVPLHLDRFKWDKLFEQLLDLGYADEELLGLGAKWVRQHRNYGQTPPLTAKILGASTCTADMDDLAGWLRNWVDLHPDHGQTKFVRGFLRSELRIDRNAVAELSGWTALLEWLKRPSSILDVATFERLQQAQIAGHRVRGRIERRAPKGLVVKLLDFGASAFLPRFQVDLRYPADLDAYLGLEGEFKIAKLDAERRSVVVSRRAVLEVERSNQRLAAIQEGDVVEGVVVKVVDYGAAINVGGLKGVLHKSEMSWRRCIDPTQVCFPGQRLTLRVLRLDREERQVYLGLKQLTPSPWDGIEQTLPPGTRTRGIVVHLEDSEATVDLSCGLQGAVHLDELDPPRLASW